MSRFMDYGPDWPPAPVRAVPRVSGWAAGCRRFRFWFYTLLVTALVGLAAFAIIDDRIEPNRGEVTIIWNDPSPHPAIVYSHP